MSLTGTVKEYVRAAFSGIWVRTAEPDEAQAELVKLASQEGWRICVWDIVNGASFPLEKDTRAPALGEPAAVLKGIASYAGSETKAVLLLMHNLHKFVGSVSVMQAAFNAIIAGKKNGVFIVGLAPTAELPVELQKVFVTVEHNLPTKRELEQIALELATEHPDKLPPLEQRSVLWEAASGLTRYEAEGAFSLAIIRGQMEPETIWGLKSGMIAKSGLATLYRGRDVTFETLKGLGHLQNLSRQLLRPDCPIPPKGFLFIGPPGGGKTSVVKAIAADNGLPLIMADMGALKGSLVGQSEERVRRLIALCESMAPCVVLIDEIEDALAGATSDHVGDSGVAKDQLSAILKWRSESKSRTFLCGTCNDPQKIMDVKQGALTRDGRFDGVVFVDLPGREMKEEIWKFYFKKYLGGKLDFRETCVPQCEGWSPGNIEVCCQRAVQYAISIEEAAKYVRPTEPDKVDAIRNWASGRCLSAYEPGLYQKGQGGDVRPESKGRRALAR